MSVHNKEIGIKRTILSADGGIDHYERVERQFNELTKQLMMSANYTSGCIGKYRLLDDAYRGSGGFEDGSYLVPFPVEKAEKYARRKDLAYYINFIKPIIDSHVNPIFKSDPVRDNMSDTFKLFLNNVDGNNTTLTRFMKKASIRAKLHGVEFIVIDAPKVDPNIVLTKKRVIDERIYPYLYLVSPSQVTNYARDKFGKLISITYSIQNDIVQEDGSVKTITETWTWTDTICKKIVNNEEEVFENTVGKIPVIPLYGVLNATDDLIPQSDLYGIARSSFALYNLLSAITCVNRNQAFNILVYPIGDEDEYEDPENDPIRVGVSDTLLYRNGQQSPKFISPSDKPTDMMMAEANLIIKEIFRQANLTFMNQQNISNVSGLAKKWDNLQLFRTILDLAENLQATERLIGLLFGKYMNEDMSSYYVTYNKEYGVIDVSETLANALTTFGFNISDGLNYEVKKKVIRAMTDDLDSSVTQGLIEELDNMPNKGVAIDVSGVSAVQPTST
jgi:hypothetical protein